MTVISNRTMTYYITDESQFVAHYGPPSNSQYYDPNHKYTCDPYDGVNTKTCTPMPVLSTSRSQKQGSASTVRSSSSSPTRPCSSNYSCGNNSLRSSIGVGTILSLHSSHPSDGVFSQLDSICSSQESVDTPPSKKTTTKSYFQLRPGPASNSVTSSKSPARSVPQQRQQQYEQDYLERVYYQQKYSQGRHRGGTSSSAAAVATSQHTRSPSPSSIIEDDAAAAAAPPPPVSRPLPLDRRRSQTSNHVLPRVTSAAAPYQNMIAPSSYLYDELLKDPGYRHALNAGTLWQSLCSQHVHFPSLWYDGEEPSRPPMGCPRRRTPTTSPQSRHQPHAKWLYFGRHRVQGDFKLNSLIGNRGSSGRLLLHLMVVDGDGDVMADIAIGCFHPNARGVRVLLQHDPDLEDCRDVWLGYRSRTSDSKSSSRLQVMLKHFNKGRIHPTPLGPVKEDSDVNTIDNDNLRAVFGKSPPLFTRIVQEQELQDVFYTYHQMNHGRTCPASIVLMRQYLLEEEL